MSCLGIRVVGSVRSVFPPAGRRPRLVVPSELKLSDGGGEVVGCSHGWAAVFNKRNDHLFLSDPLSHHRINLPSIRTLPDPHLNLDLDGHGSVSKLALSSSPLDDDCRAVMIFGPTRRLAFCSPRRSSEWTPIGDAFFHIYFHQHEEDPYEIRARVHADLVYCSKRKVFTAVTAGDINLRTLVDDGLVAFENGEHVFWTDSLMGDGRFSLRYDWDVEDPYSSRLVRTFELMNGVVDTGEDTIDWVERNIEVLENECVQIPHLVYAEDKDEVFVAVQFVRLMNEKGDDIDRPLGYVPKCEYRGLRGVFPGKTYGFVVIKMNDEGKHIDFSVLDGEDMNGMTMFLGINHSSFVTHEDEDEDEDEFKFKPNSIYFSDARRIGKRSTEKEHDKVYGRRRYWLEQWVDSQLAKSESPGNFNKTLTANSRNIDEIESRLRNFRKQYQAPAYVPRRSYHHRKQHSIGDEASFVGSPITPAYMASTESAKAKARSLSSLRLRPLSFDVCSEVTSPF